MKRPPIHLVLPLTLLIVVLIAYAGMQIYMKRLADHQALQAEYYRIRGLKQELWYGMVHEGSSDEKRKALHYLEKRLEKIEATLQDEK